jgi:dTDP-glucose 4,6-dehydratase
MMPDLLPEDRDLFLQLTSPLWETMREQRFFITGGTGFIGSWLLESFIWANDRHRLGASATVLTRDPAAFRRKSPRLAAHPSLCLHTGDVRSFDFPDGPFRFVLHAATDANIQSAYNAPLETVETIIDGTRRTLAFARSHGAARFLLASSGAIYGRQPANVTHVPETYSGAPDCTRPESSYGEGKRLAELLCAMQTAQPGLECMIARCFSFAGPYLPPDASFAFGNFVRDAIAGRPISVKGDGTPMRSYLYAMDLAVWLWTILFRGVPGRAYNVGSEDAVSIADLAAEISAAVQPPSPVTVAAPPVPGGDVQRYVPSTERARGELSLREYTDRRTTIMRTAQWYRQTLTARCV